MTLNVVNDNVNGDANDNVMQRSVPEFNAIQYNDSNIMEWMCTTTCMYT